MLNHIDFLNLKLHTNNTDKIKYLEWRFWISHEEAVKLFEYIRKDLI